MKSKEKTKEDDFFVNFTGRTKFYAQLVQYGFIIACIGLISKYILLLYKLNDLDGIVGRLFGGIADFGGLVGIIGFCILIFGLISIAFLGNKVHLYLRIGILIALALIIRSLFSYSFFF